MNSSIRIFAILSLILCLIVSLLTSCSRSLKSVDSFDRLNPVEALPEPTPDDNLVVKIDNVADVGTSCKNKAELFINKKRIRLAKDAVGYQQDYHYHLRLQPGVYKVEAIYYVKKSRGFKKYKITTQDGKFRVYSDKRTELTIMLDKKLNGRPVFKKNFFEETYLQVGRSVSEIKDNQFQAVPEQKLGRLKSNRSYPIKTKRK